MHPGRAWAEAALHSDEVQQAVRRTPSSGPPRIPHVGISGVTNTGGSGWHLAHASGAHARMHALARGGASVGVADGVEGLAEVVGERVGCGGEGFITMSATRSYGGIRR